MTLTAYGKNAKKALDEAVDEINNIEQPFYYHSYFSLYLLMFHIRKAFLQ